MNLKNFYEDLYRWVESINQKGQQLSNEEYWAYVMDSGGQLSRKYQENALVKKVILAHLDFLEENYRK